MITREFVIKKDEFERRKSSILQHKLRPTLKCYTIVDFVMDETTNEYTFTKTYMKKGIQIEDKTPKKGTYKASKIPGSDSIILTVMVY